MALLLNEEQQLLRDTAFSFFADKAPVSQLRVLRDRQDDTGYEAGLWSEMAEMGFAGLLVAEEYGGSAFGTVGAGLVAEAMGHTLAASPFFASSVVAASLVELAGSAADKNTLLPQIASGEKIYTFAHDETARHTEQDRTTVATSAGGGYALTGLKTFVPDGHVADGFIVSAVLDGVLALFVVERGASGLIVDRTIMADSRNWAKVTLEGAPARLLGEAGSVAEAAVAAALDRARAVLAAEMLGIADNCLARTLAYLKERKQFGVTIGGFQALQHRAAHLYSEIEVTRSAVLKALMVADETPQDLPLYASIAKGKASQVAELATNEAIQMHGGIGMTDEFDLGFYIKRARTLQQLYGDYNFHTDRFATLNGY